MAEEILEILFDEQRIRSRVGELAREITKDYRGRQLVLVSILLPLVQRFVSHG